MSGVLATSATPGASVLVTPGADPSLAMEAIRAALRQTCSELEVLVPSASPWKAAASEVVASQSEGPQLRWLTSKASSSLRGALDAARGPTILILSGEELWLPRHVEMLLEKVRETGVAHAQYVNVQPGGQVIPAPVSLEVEALRAATSDAGRIPPLGAWGFSREVLKELLEQGAPGTFDPDLTGVVTGSGDAIRCTHAPTLLHFPPEARQGWTAPYLSGERLAWSKKLSSFEQLRALEDSLAAAVVTHHAQVSIELGALQEREARLRQQHAERVEQMEEDYRLLEADHRILIAERQRLHARIAELEARGRRVGT